ncbi:hypothetical protein [Streptomyces sp. NPDC001914]|uniref:DUF7224 domain-containing protein n=1 Tax=Streptomyces sp. NPDC001914 TaxID=3364623 RepID=UPI0036A31DF3
MYAAASAVSAWESGTLRKAGVWEMLATRSRLSIATQSLIPVVLLCWIALIIPPAISLAGEGVWPNWLSLRPVFMGLIVVVCHAVIGFTIGTKVSRVLAAPLLAIGVWIAVAFSITVDTPWVRHVSGEFPEQLMFGEAAAFSALWPHVALSGSIAAALALLWSPLRRVWISISLSTIIALSGTLGTYLAVRDYGYNAPLITGAAQMSCAKATESHPTICVPEAADQYLPEATQFASKILADFQKAGIKRRPSLITDSLPDGRFSRPSTRSTWRVPITLAAQEKDLEFAMVVSAVELPCGRPDPYARRTTLSWASHITSTQEAWEKYRNHIDRGIKNERVEKEVARVLSMTPEKQATWFNRTVSKACGA